MGTKFHMASNVTTIMLLLLMDVQIASLLLDIVVPPQQQGLFKLVPLPVEIMR